jgi:hypothetical protein
MSAVLQPQTAKSRILVMGPQASAFVAALVRLKGNSEISHAETAAEAIEMLNNGHFDHVLIDNRTDGALTLTIPRLAMLKSIGRLTVLAGPNSSQTIAAIPGIGQVITPPYNPIEIANSLGIEIKDSRKLDESDNEYSRRSDDDAEVLEQVSKADEIKPDNFETEEEAPLFIRAIVSIANFIPGLTPLISMLYKNVALTILAALFVAFISYGIMIAFFLTSGDWSSPLQLQTGHEMVRKAEAEINELQVKRNLISQQLSEAKNKAEEGRSALLRANMLAEITAGIIDQEIANHKDRFENLASETEILKQVVEGFGSANDRKASVKNLKRDFANRLITRNVYQSTMLNIAQIERQVADLREQITVKKTMTKTMDQSVDYLDSLKRQMTDEDAVFSGTGQTAYVPLTNQIIEVRQIRSTAKSLINSTQKSIPALEDSLTVVNRGIANLNASPMIAALDKPVTVLFVPYDNIDAYTKGEPIYSCALALFWCSNVGATGDAISGEITTTHPFFGKPIRGQFVEAILTDPTAAKKDIIHVGRPPFFF